MKPTIIMISGYARSGKDTLANAFLEAAQGHGRAKVSFATPLKKAVQLALNYLGLSHIDAFTEDPKLKALLRPLYVEVGKAARAIDKDVFVKAAWREVWGIIDKKDDIVVIPDLRYANEIEYFRSMSVTHGSHVFHMHIDRFGNEAANEEERESVKALPNPDCGVMFQDGQIEDIKKCARELILGIRFPEKYVTVQSSCSVGKSAVAGPVHPWTAWAENEKAFFKLNNTQPMFTKPWEEEIRALDATLDKLSQRVDHLDERMTKLRDYAGGRTDRLLDKIRELEARLEKLEGNPNA